MRSTLVPLKCDLLVLISVHFWGGRGKLVPVKGKALLFEFREAAEQHTTVTTNRSAVRGPQRAPMSDTLSLVLPSSWRVCGVEGSAGERSSAQLQRPPGTFCRTGFHAPCGASGEGCVPWGFRGENQNFVGIEHFVSYSTECESAKSRSAVAQPEMQR